MGGSLLFDLSLHLCGGTCLDLEDSGVGICGYVCVGVSMVGSMLMAVLYAYGLVVRD